MQAGFIIYTVKNWKQTTTKKQGLVENVDIVHPILSCIFSECQLWLLTNTTIQ